MEVGDDRRVPGQQTPERAGPVRGAVQDVVRSLPDWRQWRTALCRTPLSVWRDDLTDWAASLTYYSVLALLPAMIVTVSLIGLADPPATGQLIEHISALAPAQSGATLHRALISMSHQRTAAWLVVGGATVSAVWSSCSYLAVFRRALHAMHRVKDDRPPWSKAPRILGTALVLLASLIGSAVALLASGPLARAMGRAVGLGRAAEVTWSVVKWPLLLCLVTVLVLVLFRSGPPASRGVRRGVPGGVLAVLLWLVSSAGFALYASYVGTFNRLYGSLAGPVVFLIWLWFSHLSLLTGAQFNAELTRAAPRAGRGGVRDQDRGPDRVSGPRGPLRRLRSAARGRSPVR